jgi:hypothetical protein
MSKLTSVLAVPKNGGVLGYPPESIHAGSPLSSSGFFRKEKEHCDEFAFASAQIFSQLRCIRKNAAKMYLGLGALFSADTRENGRFYWSKSAVNNS